jgi:hypothetical protein
MGTRLELLSSAETAPLSGGPAPATTDAGPFALYRFCMAAGEDKVTVTLDAELVECARIELGLVSEGDRTVVERVLDAYLIGRQLDATQSRAGLSEQQAERAAYEELDAARRERGVR